MSSSKLAARIVLGLLPATLLAGPGALAQDPVKIAPDVYKVAFENEHVRVLQVLAKPGQKVAMHAHPDYVVYMLADGKIQFSSADGQQEVREAKAGSAQFVKGESHAAENVAKTDHKAVVVELKGAAGGPAPKGEDAAKCAPEATKVLLDNERVRVLETRLKPGGKLPMHVHPGNVAYSITAAKLKFTDADGKPTDRELAPGTAIWNNPVAHAVENVGTAEVHALNIEIKPAAKKDEKKAP